MGKFWKKKFFEPVDVTSGDNEELFYDDGDAPASGYGYEDEQTDHNEEYYEPSFSRKRTNVLQMPETKTSYDGGANMNMNMIIFKPTEYDQAQTIIDYLKLKKSIIVNLDEIDVNVAQRILDFITGAVYALAGDIKKAARNIFVVVPSNVEISTGDDEEVVQESNFEQDYDMNDLV